MIFGLLLYFTVAYENQYCSDKDIIDHCSDFANGKELIINATQNSLSAGKYCQCTGSTRATVKISLSYIPQDSFYEATVITGVTLDGVTSIGLGAFYGCVNLKSITFPETVTSIGESSFERSGLTSFSFVRGNDEKLTTISDNAFYGLPLNSPNFNTISFPDSLTYIGPSAFENSNFTGKITVGSHLTTIDNKAFYNVAGLNTFSINVAKGNIFPDTITTIGDYAFDNTGLTGAIGFGDAKLNYIGKYAFEGLALTESLSIQFNTGGTICDHAFLNSGVNENLSIKDATIEDYAFESKSFESLSLDGCTVEGYAFVKCSISKSMEFRDTTFDSDAFIKGKYTNNQNSEILFYGCTVNTLAFNTFTFSDCTLNFTDTSFEIKAFETLIGKPRIVFNHDDENHKDATYQIGERAFYNTGILGNSRNNLEIPEAYDQIGPYAFAFCKGLTGDLIVNSSTIDDFAFYYSGFTGQLKLDTNVDSLAPNINTGDDANIFKGCQFTSLWLNNTGSIPKRCFYKMNSIKGALYFPETITLIGEESFYGLDQVSKLEFEKNPNEPLELSTGSFAKCSGISNSIEFERDIIERTLIPKYVFYQCSKIPSVTFPKELKTIDKYAFYECIGLQSLTLPDELTTIGEYAFYGCTGLKGDLIIPPGFTGTGNNFGEHAFHGCSNLAGKLEISHVVIIPSYAFYKCGFNGELDVSGARSIGSYAFYGCEGFSQSLHLNEDPPNYLSIDGHAFQGCTHLKGPLNLQRVISLESHAFYGCSELDGTLDNLPSTINPYIFYECKSLKGPIQWPSSLTTIGSHSFYGCTGLDNELNLPTSVKDIGDYAFAGCSGLTGPLIFQDIEHIMEHAFDGCTGLTGSLRIPATFIEIEKYAFNGCSGFSGQLEIDVSNKAIDSSGHVVPKQPTIRDHAFNDCTGFKKGTLSIFIHEEEEEYSITSYQLSPYYRYKYFLRIENEAFEGTKFKNVYYNGRFQPDCDYDIGISQIKGIHTSSNYVNKTFCGNPIHKSKLSGGAIAGIVIACVVVVAAIVVLIVLLILKNKKNKDKSEGEVEMNGD